MMDRTDLGTLAGSIADPRGDRERRYRELARDLGSAALLRGDFVLSSGAHTSYYLDKYRFETRPGLLRRVASFLAEMLPPATDRIVGQELGGVPLVTAVSLETGLPFVLVRRQTGPSGQDLEGELHRGERATVLEDVVSTGVQASRTAGVVRATGAEILEVIAVVDREEGATDLLAASDYPFRSLYRAVDLMP